MGIKWEIYKILNKSLYVELGNAWEDFDHTTAYGCQLRNVEYDEELNRRCWEQYQALALQHLEFMFSSPFNVV